jgi:hypothetical protein
MWASSWFVNEPLLSQTATQVWLFLGIPTVPRRNDVDYLTTYGPRASLPYSDDEKVANRHVRVWHGATENGPRTPDKPQTFAAYV